MIEVLVHEIVCWKRDDSKKLTHVLLAQHSHLQAKLGERQHLGQRIVTNRRDGFQPKRCKQIGETFGEFRVVRVSRLVCLGYSTDGIAVEYDVIPLEIESHA